MKRVAVVLGADGTLAPLDDSGRSFSAVRVFEVREGKAVEHEFADDPAAEGFSLGKALRKARVTDVIAQHFEKRQFDELGRHGFHLWLEAPDADAQTAQQAWHDGKLPEAKSAARAVKGPDGKRLHYPRERHGGHEPPGGDRGVRSPIEGGKTPF
jgi:hypothetical protein